MKSTGTMIFLLTGALTLSLAGCGGTTTIAETSTAGQLNANYENALPVESQLILGTLLLEDTENAVTAEQAAELLPMYQMLKTLEASDTAATVEKQGLIGQIQETMTEAQIRAIADMQLTQSEMNAYMKEAGMAPAMQRTGTPGSSNSGNGGFRGGMGGDSPGGFEGGMPPGGGGMPDGGGMGGNSGQSLTSEQIATMEARRASRGGAWGSSMLLETLIRLLETKQPTETPV